MRNPRDLADNLAAISDYGLFLLTWKYISTLRAQHNDEIFDGCEEIYESRREREGQLQTKLVEQDLEIFEETLKALDDLVTSRVRDIVDNLIEELSPPVEEPKPGLRVIDGGLSGSVEKN
tara:strand:+ start:212 stop:571 length:360 start_codon:yes stop_codon:yes gene_type:complete